MQQSGDVGRTGTGPFPEKVPACRASEPRGTPRAKDCVPISLSFVLKNDAALIPPVIAQFHEAANRFRLFDESTANRVGMAVQEAMLNGMHHGNLELDSRLRQGDDRAYRRLAVTRTKAAPYRGRRLHVEARFDRDAAVFTIRDEGRGFDPALLPDPTLPPSLERASGRGLLLIRSFMDEVSFNEAGNEITLVKRCTCHG
jgi:anti-sigma regulatory factor (Ser/Thr protein kinase)